MHTERLGPSRLEPFLTKTVSQILQNEQHTWSEVVGYVRRHEVDCDLWVGDTLDVPLTPEAAAIAKATFERCKAAGGKVDHVKVTHDPAEAEKVRLQGRHHTSLRHALCHD